MNYLRCGVSISHRASSFPNHSRFLSTLKRNARARKSSTVEREIDFKQQNDDASQQKKEAYQDLMKNINNKYGKGTMMTLSDKPLSVPKRPTGLAALDFVLGGGVPIGRVVEIFGPEGSGKTTLALTIMAAFEKAGGSIVYCDVENAIAPDYCKALGVSEEMAILQPSSGEETFDILDTIVKSRVVAAVCVDSVAALVPLAEIVASVEENQMALQARLMSKSMRKLTTSNSKAEEDGCSLIFINQLRSKVGVIFGNPETRPGGKALPYHSSIILDIRIVEKIFSEEDKNEVIGNVVKISVKKNKIASPGKTVQLHLIHGKGFCKFESLVTAAVQMGVIETKHSWYSYADKRLGQGRNNVIKQLKEDKSLYVEIEEKTWAEFHARNAPTDEDELLVNGQGDEKNENKNGVGMNGSEVDDDDTQHEHLAN